MAGAVAITLRDIHDATASQDQCIAWMRANGLLSGQMNCPKCGAIMTERPYARIQEGIAWRCQVRQCRATASIRRGSFFERSQLPLKKLLDVISYWALEMSNDNIEHQVSRH